MTLSVDRSVWPNAPISAVCECKHGRGMHNIRTNGSRSACSVSDGPKATPCGCPSFREASPVSLPKEESREPLPESTPLPLESRTP